MHKKCLKRIAIAGGVSIILGLLFLLPQTQSQPAAQQNKKVAVNRQKSKMTAIPRGIRQSDASEQTLHFQDTQFYSVIIKNNLFRPLGWTPSRPKNYYRLLGTLIPKDRDTPRKAILQATVGDTTYTVRIGERLGEYTLINIRPKQVTLEKDGQTQTLKLNTSLWIK